MASQRGGEGGLPPPSSELKCKCGPEKKKGGGEKRRKVKAKEAHGKEDKKGQEGTNGI